MRRAALPDAMSRGCRAAVAALPARTGAHCALVLSMLVARAPSACEGVAVESGWVRAAPPGAKMTAAYFVLVNRGQATATVTHLSAAPPLTATLHATHVHDGRAHMRALETLDIPAGARLEAAPGGLHAMLELADQPLAGPVTLTFHCGGTTLTAELPISRHGGD